MLRHLTCYTVPLQVTAHITSLHGAGETRTISTANLLRMHSEESALLEARNSDKEEWVDDIINISRGRNPSVLPGAGTVEVLDGSWPM